MRCSASRAWASPRVGAEAGELIHLLVPLMHAGVSARAIVDAEIAHPTWAEGVQSVLMQLAQPERVVFFDIEPKPIASSGLRTDFDEAGVPSAVAAIIRRDGLYGVSARVQSG